MNKALLAGLCSKSCVRRAEGVAYPFDRSIAVSVGVDTENVEAYRAIREPLVPRQEHRRCANNFLLLAIVNGEPGCHE